MFPTIRPISMHSVLSALDNERSLWPLLTKDVIDNTGRTLMEYKRGGKGSHHAGRERAIEEFATTAVWIGGKKLLDVALLNPVIRAFGLDPKVDIMLFLKNHGQKIPEYIAARKNAYLTANLLRFAIGTLVPVAVIGWVIPRINQAITRRRLAEEAGMHGASNAGKRVMKPAQTKPSTRYAQPTTADFPQFRVPMSQAGIMMPAVTGYYNAYRTSNPVMAHYGSAYPYASARWAGHTGKGGQAGGSPRFGNAVLLKAASLINNDFWGNVAIDMGISSGRLYQARNWVDFMEVAGREASIIAFLYFLGDFVKGRLRRWFDNTKGTVTDLTYNSIKWLRETPVSRAVWQQEMAMLKGLTSHNAFNAIAAKLNPLTGRFDHNPILELARHQGLISVLSPSEKLGADTLRKLLGRQAVDTGHHYLDPRMLLDIGGIQESLIQRTGSSSGFFGKLLGRLRGMLGMAAKAEGQQVEQGIVRQLLSKTNPSRFTHTMGDLLAATSRYKGLAIVAGIAISTSFLGFIMPAVQHWVTQRLTGSVDFPGVRQDAGSIREKARLSGLPFQK